MRKHAQVWAMGMDAKQGDKLVKFDNGAPNRFVDVDEYEVVWRQRNSLLQIIRNMASASEAAMQELYALGLSEIEESSP